MAAIRCVVCLFGARMMCARARAARVRVVSLPCFSPGDMSPVVGAYKRARDCDSPSTGYPDGSFCLPTIPSHTSAALFKMPALPLSAGSLGHHDHAENVTFCPPRNARWYSFLLFFFYLRLGVNVSKNRHRLPRHRRHQPRALVVAAHGQQSSVGGP